MSANLERKKQIVQEIRSYVDSSKAVIFYNFHFINNEKAFLLKKELKQTNAKWKVYKNNLFIKSLDEDKAKSLKLKQANVIIFCQDDKYQPLKILHKFDQSNFGKSKINGGIYEEDYFPADTLQKWALLPAKEQSLQTLCYYLEYNLRYFVNVLDQLIDQKKNS